MPLWNEYRDENDNYVPREVAEEQAKACGRRASEMYKLVEVYEKQFPENYSFSVDSFIRGTGKPYSPDLNEVTLQVQENGTTTSVKRIKHD